jgi:hypothetical protein
MRRGLAKRAAQALDHRMVRISDQRSLNAIR